VNKFGILLAAVFVIFGITNLVHLLNLHLYASCGRALVLPCFGSSQTFGELGARIFGLAAIGIGVFVGWLSWQKKT
jgi:hypothetical protein